MNRHHTGWGRLGALGQLLLSAMVLLAVTVGAAYLDLGPFNAAVAMAIALVKALLIILFFMHVRRADGLTRLAVATGFFWLALLLTLTLSDFMLRGQ